MKQKHLYLEILFEKGMKANKTCEQNIFDFCDLHPVEPIDSNCCIDFKLMKSVLKFCPQQ